MFSAVRGRLVIIAGLALVGAIAGVLPFVAIIELVRTLWPGLSGGPVETSRAWAVVIGGAAALVVGFLAAVGSSMISHLADNDLQLDLRSRIVRHLRTLPLGWFDRRSSGTVKKLVENDVAALHQLVAHAIQDTITAIAVPVISLVYLFAVDWRMATASVLPVLLTVVLYSIMMRGGQQKYVEYDASVVRLNGATIEYVHGIAVVKSFGQAGRSHARYREETRRFVRFYDGWMRETSALSSTIELITSPVIILVYLSAVGFWLVGAGLITPLNVLPALLLGLGLTAPMLQLGATSQFLRNATKARGSLAEFFRTPPITEPADPAEPAGTDVALRDVSFGYDHDHRVLHEIAARCEPGTVTALVGASGSGKSTLARLVPRFYDPTAGTVEIGSTDVSTIAGRRLYADIGFVFQDAYLLRASIRDNLRLTRPDADDAAVERAARAAQIHHRILRLPRGYDSVIGSEATLSGGEAQRLTIARALLTDAPILVLDEATAFADPDSEAAIQLALSRLAAGRTLLVIAHRLHTITGVDQLLVLDAGRIVERGTHDQLATAGGPYQALWEQYQRARSGSSRLEVAG